MREGLISLPMVPLRGLVAFPYTVMNFEVGRPSSIAAVKAVTAGSGEIFLVAQKNARTEMPNQEEMYEIGVVAKVRHVVRMQDRMARVLVEGLYRAKLVEIEKKKAIALRTFCQ